MAEAVGSWIADIGKFLLWLIAFVILVLVTPWLVWLYDSFSRININTTSPQVLARRLSLRPRLAQAIWNFHKEHGDFQNIEDITEVPGIGTKTFAKLERKIKVRTFLRFDGRRYAIAAWRNIFRPISQFIKDAIEEAHQ